MDHGMQCPLPLPVLDAMLTAATSIGHPLSPHADGARASDMLDVARSNVAKLMSASPEEVIFTSGGTEANNAAVWGLSAAAEGKGRHIIVSAIEHLSVMDAAERLVRQGWEITRLPVDRYGMIDPDDLRKSLRAQTALVCVTAASDELGTIEPVEAIAAVCRAAGAILHVDAVQAAGHIPLNMAEQLDSMSISGSPMYAPAGIGALVVRKGVRYVPMIIGGGGEEGRRGGAPNLIGAAGLGAAAFLAGERMEEIEMRLIPLRKRLTQGILDRIPDAGLIGHPVLRLPGHAAFVIPGAEGEVIVRELDMEGVRASSGSICSRWAMKPSHVISATGIGPETAKNVIQFTLGEGNSEEQVDYVLDILPKIISRVRNLS